MACQNIALHYYKGMLVTSYNLPSNIKGIIFDCDGVILDSKESTILYFNKILQALNLDPLTKEQESYMFMSSVKNGFKHVIPKHLQSKLQFICTEVVNYQRDFMPMVKLESGFFEFSNWLKSKGVKRAIHTNRSSGMQVVLDKFPFLNNFNPIMTAANVAAKPDPEGTIYILNKWNLRSDEVIFVGDSLNDQKTAFSAKVPFVAYGNEQLEATVHVNSFKVLQDKLNSHIHLPS